MKTISFLLFVFLLINNVLLSQEREIKTDSIAVLFNYNHSQILNAQLLETSLKKVQVPISKIVLIGYTDSLGKTSDNVLLASKRIMAISKYLERSAWSNVKIEVQNANETSGYPTSNLETNRRVDILVYTIVEDVKPKVELNKLINLNINFEGGKAVIVRESYENLERLRTVMQEDSTLTLKLFGHVCCMNDYPMSLKRANTIRDYLVQSGIDIARFTTEGFSNSKPLVPETDEASQAMNRRVEALFERK